MSNPKKYVNKIGMVLTHVQEVNVGPKIKQTTSIKKYSFAFAVEWYRYLCRGLYESGLFEFESCVNLLCYYYLNLVWYILGFDIPI